jgi:O-antigen/teichoic acid export membrane protein
MYVKNKTSIWYPILKAGGTATLNRVVNIGMRLFTIPIVINYLGTERYGLWLTISSIAGYILLLDFGISSAALNKLTKFYTEKENKSADKYIFSNLVFFTAVSFLIFIITISVVPNLDWVILMKLKTFTNAKEINGALVICISMFLIKLSTIIILKIPYAMQNGVLSETSLLIGNILSFLAIILCIKYDLGLMPLIISITSGHVTAAIIVVTYLRIKKKINFYRPKKGEFIEAIKDIRKTGLHFILIQLSSILITSSQFSILAFFHGAENVTSYGILFQIMIALQTPVAVLQQPLWSKFVQLDILNKRSTIKDILIKYLNYTLAYSAFVALFLIFILPYVLPIVINEPLEIPLKLRIGFAIWSVSSLVFGGLTVSLFAMNLTKQMAVISVFQLLIFFISAYLFVPSLKTTGMVTSMIVMFLITIPIAFNIFHKKILINFDE